MRTQTEQNERTLEEVAPGERGVILQVGNENGPVKRRLVDMGLTPGTEVTVRKVAPFGDPVELNLRGYELSLRKADAAQIRVATGAEGERRAQTRRRRIGMVQHIPDEETLRRMDADHAHEAAEHGGVPDYASHDTREMKLALVGNPNCGKTTLMIDESVLEEGVIQCPGCRQKFALDLSDDCCCGDGDEDGCGCGCEEHDHD